MNERISFSKGVDLFQKASLEELQQRAQWIRNHKNPPSRVTFVLDSNPNYTNVCSIDCSFCAFYRHTSAKDAYTKTVDEVMNHFAYARAAGLSTVLLQGGVHPDLPLSYYVDLIHAAREQYPDIHPHCFSAVEIWHVAEKERVSTLEVLKALWAAGLRTLPGGG